MSQHPKSHPLLTIPFRLRSYPGEVRVRYQSNEDPRHWGMHHLGLPLDLDVARGFPVLHAEISYGGAGYHAELGPSFWTE